MSHGFERRRMLGWIGATALAPLAATPALADDRPATPRMSEGPFYPRSFPQDVDADLTRVTGKAVAAQGTLLEVSGRVLDRSGRPRSGARVEIWQCDALGHYHHVGESRGSVAWGGSQDSVAGDPGFQGFGAVTADADGRYAFRTIKPAPYPGRTPHIHFTVLESGRRRLTSQMFIEGEAGNARDGLYRRLGADAPLVTMKLAHAGRGLAGTLDIVLG